MIAVRHSIYRPRGAALELLDSTEPEVLLCGPANTGKSRGVGECLFRDLASNPNCRIAAVRKTRASLTESFLVTWEDEVLGDGVDRAYLAPGSQLHNGAGRAHRSSYEFKNGSVLVPCGLDRPSRLFSTQWDKIYVQEAIELTLNEWESLNRGLRNKRIPHPKGGIDKLTRKPRNLNQLIADTNPDAPRHWLKLRCDAGITRMIHCRHTDNPTFSASDQAALDRLSGVRRLRLRDGVWAAAEGMIWENWDPAVHVVAKAPKCKLYFAGVDWGFTHAGCIVVVGIDDEGRAWVVRQVYQTSRLIDWWTTKALHLQAEFRIRRFVCDPAQPGNIEKFRQAGVPAVPADNEVMAGLDSVRDRLAKAEDGKPRLFVLDHSLDSPDSLLAEAREPVCLQDEIPGYVYATSPDGEYTKEEPAPRQADHACDTLRYVVRHLDRAVRPERKEEKVFKPGSYGEVMEYEKVFTDDGDD